MSELLITIATLFLPLIACFIINTIRKRLGENRFNELFGAVLTIVKIAEKLYPNLGKKRGVEKFNFVKEEMRTLFKNLNDKDATTLIETAVEEYHNINEIEEENRELQQ